MKRDELISWLGQITFRSTEVKLILLFIFLRSHYFGSAALDLS